MDPISGEPLNDADCWITLQPLNPNPIPQPPEGLLRIDLTIVQTFSQIGNPTRVTETERVPTLDIPGTTSRTQFSMTMNCWLHDHSDLEADVANIFTGAVIEYVFQNHVDWRGMLAGHVAAELGYVVYEEVEDVKKGLCEYCIEILRDEYVFLAAAAEEEIGDCSICLEKLVSGDEKKKKKKKKTKTKKKNYLFKSPCRHVFHDECMTEWLRNSNSCPLCRYVMSSDVVSSDVVLSEVTDMDLD